MHLMLPCAAVPLSPCFAGTRAVTSLSSALAPVRQAAAVRPLAQGFLSRGLVAWRAHKHAAAEPSGGAARADGAGAAAQGPEAAGEAAAVRAALVLTYSQRCQVRPAARPWVGMQAWRCMACDVLGNAVLARHAVFWPRSHYTRHLCQVRLVRCI